MQKFFVLMTAIILACGILAVSALDVKAASIVTAKNDRNVKARFIRTYKDKQSNKPINVFLIENDHSDKVVIRLADFVSNCAKSTNFTFKEPLAPGNAKEIQLWNTCGTAYTNDAIRSFEAKTGPAKRRR